MDPVPHPSAGRVRPHVIPVDGPGRTRCHGGLAFLSTRQTAMGDEDVSGQALYIAGRMLFAGYGEVIGML